MTRAVVQFLSFVVVRRHFEQPRVVDLNHLSHELLGREDEFVVDEPAWSVLSETTVGVNSHSLLVLHRLVLSTLAQSRRMVEEPGSHCLYTSTSAISTQHGPRATAALSLPPTVNIKA